MVDEVKGRFIVTADHGNADDMAQVGAALSAHSAGSAWVSRHPSPCAPQSAGCRQVLANVGRRCMPLERCSEPGVQLVHASRRSSHHIANPPHAPRTPANCSATRRPSSRWCRRARWCRSRPTRSRQVSTRPPAPAPPRGCMSLGANSSRVPGRQTAPWLIQPCQHVATCLQRAQPSWPPILPPARAAHAAAPRCSPPAVPFFIGGAGLPADIKLRDDLPDAGLANVAATVFNLMGFEVGAGLPQQRCLVLLMLAYHVGGVVGDGPPAARLPACLARGITPPSPRPLCPQAPSHMQPTLLA